MGKNKLAKFDDMASYPHVFQYPFATLQEKGFELKGHWHEQFFKNDNPIVLELGCGKGEYTVGLGKLFPNKNFIGVDIKGARMWTGAKESLEAGMTNVAFLRTSIELIAHFFAAGEVAEIWLTFPDPQMKKANKRLTSTRFMKMYREILAGGGRRDHTSENRQQLHVHLHLRDGKSKSLSRTVQQRRFVSFGADRQHSFYQDLL